MIQELENRIRERAHSIWESEGRPADRAEIHWKMARDEITAETPPAAPAEAPARRTRKPAAPRSKAAPKHA